MAWVEWTRRLVGENVRGTACRIFSIVRKASSRSKKRSNGRVLTRGLNMILLKKKKKRLYCNIIHTPCSLLIYSVYLLFSIVTKLCKQHHNQSWDIFVPAKRNHLLTWVHHSFCLYVYNLFSSHPTGFFQAIFSSRGSCLPRDRTQASWVSCIGRWVL